MNKDEKNRMRHTQFNTVSTSKQFNLQLIKDKFQPNQNLETIIKQQKQKELKFSQKRENT